MRALLQESTLAERKAFIRSFVEEIVVQSNPAVVRYTIPMPPDQIRVLPLPKKVLATVRDGEPSEIRTWLHLEQR